ncbi:MAG: arginine--tRNA ligase [Nitrososphaerales archaeon]
MTFREFKSEAENVVEEALKRSSYPTVEFNLSEPAEEHYGDLASNIAFQIAKDLRRPPMKIAEDIARLIDLSRSNLIQDVSADPPGYINFRLNYKALAERLLPSIQSSDGVKVADLGKGAKVTVEHTSVNPNKALHIGHLRNVAIGDAVYRLLKHSNYNVKVLNYIDDSGAQVADILVGFLHLNYPQEPPSDVKFDHYCGDTIYVKVNEMYEQNPNLLEKQRQILKELEDPASKISEFAKSITSKILIEQLKTCWRFGVRYDCLNFESHIVHSRLWDRVFKELKEKGIVKYAEDGRLKGCWIVEVEGEEEGEEKVLVRADGTTTYVAKDIPYAAWKIGLVEDPFNYIEYVKQPDGSPLWATDLNQGFKKTDFYGAEKTIVVIDVRQSRLQRIIKAVLSQLSKGVEDRYIHLGYAVVSLSPQTAKEMGFSEEERLLHMSGRKGIYLNADDVLDALKKKALEETVKRNPNESLEWCERVSESIAVAALKFDLLKQDLDKIVIFDLNKSLRLEGDTGPYILYSYVRACRILEKADEEDIAPTTTNINITTPTEKKLLKDLSKFDLIVEEAARNLSPKTLARYTIDLSTSFNNFYESAPVLSCSDAAIRGTRLMLVRGFKSVLGKAIDLLGLPKVERM